MLKSSTLLVLMLLCGICRPFNLVGPNTFEPTKTSPIA